MIVSRVAGVAVVLVRGPLGGLVAVARRQSLTE